MYRQRLKGSNRASSHSSVGAATNPQQQIPHYNQANTTAPNQQGQWNPTNPTTPYSTNQAVDTSNSWQNDGWDWGSEQASNEVQGQIQAIKPPPPQPVQHNVPNPTVFNQQAEHNHANFINQQNNNNNNNNNYYQPQVNNHHNGQGTQEEWGWENWDDWSANEADQANRSNMNAYNNPSTSASYNLRNQESGHVSSTLTTTGASISTSSTISSDHSFYNQYTTSQSSMVPQQPFHQEQAQPTIHQQQYGDYSNQNQNEPISSIPQHTHTTQSIHDIQHQAAVLGQVNNDVSSKQGLVSDQHPTNTKQMSQTSLEHNQFQGFNLQSQEQHNNNNHNVDSWGWQGDDWERGSFEQANNENICSPSDNISQSNSVIPTTLSNEVHNSQQAFSHNVLNDVHSVHHNVAVTKVQEPAVSQHSEAIVTSAPTLSSISSQHPNKPTVGDVYEAVNQQQIEANTRVDNESDLKVAAHIPTTQSAEIQQNPIENSQINSWDDWGESTDQDQAVSKSTSAITNTSISQTTNIAQQQIPDPEIKSDHYFSNDNNDVWDQEWGGDVEIKGETQTSSASYMQSLEADFDNMSLQSTVPLSSQDCDPTTSQSENIVASVDERTLQQELPVTSHHTQHPTDYVQQTVDATFSSVGHGDLEVAKDVADSTTDYIAAQQQQCYWNNYQEMPSHSSNNPDVELMQQPLSNHALMNEQHLLEHTQSISSQPARPPSISSVNSQPSRPSSNQSINSQPFRPPSNQSIASQPPRPFSNQSANSQPGKLPSNLLMSSQPVRPPSNQSATSQPTRPPSNHSVTSQPARPPSNQSASSQPIRPPSNLSMSSQPARPPSNHSANSQPMSLPSNQSASSQPIRPPSHQSERPSSNQFNSHPAGLPFNQPVNMPPTLPIEFEEESQVDSSSSAMINQSTYPQSQSYGYPYYTQPTNMSSQSQVCDGNNFVHSQQILQPSGQHLREDKVVQDNPELAYQNSLFAAPSDQGLQSSSNVHNLEDIKEFGKNELSIENSTNLNEKERHANNQPEVLPPVDLVSKSEESNAASLGSIGPPPMGTGPTGRVSNLRARKGSPFQPPNKKVPCSVPPVFQETSVGDSVSNNNIISPTSEAISDNINLWTDSPVLSNNSNIKLTVASDNVTSVQTDVVDNVNPIPVVIPGIKIKEEVIEPDDLPTQTTTLPVQDTVTKTLPDTGSNHRGDGASNNASVPNFRRMVPGESSKTKALNSVNNQTTHSTVPAMPSERVVTGNDDPQPVLAVRIKQEPQEIRSPPDGPDSGNDIDNTAAVVPPVRSATIGSDEPSGRPYTMVPSDGRDHGSDIRNDRTSNWDRERNRDTSRGERYRDRSRDSRDYNRDDSPRSRSYDREYDRHYEDERRRRPRDYGYENDDRRYPQHHNRRERAYRDELERYGDHPVKDERDPDYGYSKESKRRDYKNRAKDYYTYDEDYYRRSDRSQPVSRSSSFNNLENDVNRSITSGHSRDNYDRSARDGHSRERGSRDYHRERDYHRDQRDKKDPYYRAGFHPYMDPYGSGRDNYDPHYMYMQYYSQHPYYRDYYRQLMRQQYGSSYHQPEDFPDDRASTRSGRSSVNEDMKKSASSPRLPYDPYGLYRGHPYHHLNTSSLPPPSQDYHDQSLSGYGSSYMYSEQPASISHLPYHSGDVSGEPSVVDEPAPRMTPLHFRRAHISAKFTSNGEVLMVLPHDPRDGEKATVQLTSIQKMLHSNHNIISDIQQIKQYPGPLTISETHKDDVLRYCEKKKKEAQDLKNISDKESIVLLWEYLALFVTQNGKLCGTDIANLLLNSRDQKGISLSPPSSNVGQASLSPDEVTTPDTPQDEGIDLASQMSSSQVQNDAALVAKFREYACLGRKREAVNFAIREGLWGYAMALASKMDNATHTRVMAAFNNSLPSNDVLQTLFQQLSGKRPEISKTYSPERWGDWRQHLAVMVSNSSGDPQHDKTAIITLGDTLVNRGQLHAGHFCYLVAEVEWGSFSDKLSKLALIGSSCNQSFEAFATNEAIQCTEVYEYGQSLNSNVTVLETFQSYKFIYALRLAECGFPNEALKYCEVISQCINRNPSGYQCQFVSQVYELALKLKFHDLHYQMGKGEMRDMPDPEWLQLLQKDLYQIQYQAASQQQQHHHQETIMDDLNNVATPHTATPDVSYIPHMQNYNTDPYYDPSYMTATPDIVKDPEQITDVPNPLDNTTHTSNIPMIQTDSVHHVTSSESAMPAAPEMTSHYSEHSDAYGYQVTSAAPASLPYMAPLSAPDNTGVVKMEQTTTSPTSLPPNINNYHMYSGGGGGTDGLQPHSQWHQPPMTAPAYPPPLHDEVDTTQPRTAEEEEMMAMLSNKKPTSTPTTTTGAPPSSQPPTNSESSTDNQETKADDPNKTDSENRDNNSGIFKTITSMFWKNKTNQAILPDDKNPKLVYDKSKKRWVNLDGDDEDNASVPPIPMAAQGPAAGTFRGPRNKRYINPIADKDVKKAPTTTQPPLVPIVPNNLAAPPAPNFMVPGPALGAQPTNTPELEQSKIERMRYCSQSSSIDLEEDIPMDAPQAIKAENTVDAASIANDGNTMGQPMFFNPSQFQAGVPSSNSGNRRPGPSRRAFSNLNQKL